MFSCFGLFFLSLMLFALIRHSVTTKERDAEKKFWEKEDAANTVRRQDISALPYLIIPMDELPFGSDGGDPVLAECEAKLRELSGKKLLNLSNRTNTDLKLAYGAPNLTLMTEYDQNYVLLIRLLQQWGRRLYELSRRDEAACVLEHAVRLGSDIKATYLLLAEIYRETGASHKLEELKAQAEQLQSVRRDQILSQLDLPLQP